MEIDTTTLQVEVKVAEQPEYTRLYKKMTEVFPGFDDHLRKTERIIPVIEFTPMK